MEHKKEAIETLDRLWEALMACNHMETLKDHNGRSLAQQFANATGVRGAYGYVYEAIRCIATSIGCIDFDGMIEWCHNTGKPPSHYMEFRKLDAALLEWVEECSAG